jgi:D-alanine-D-alanine ligase
MDKLQCKRVLTSCGVPVVDWEAVSSTEFERSAAGCLDRLARLPAPLFVKPSCGGSSVGIRRVADPRHLADAVAFALQFDRVVLVERAITGRELECSVLGDEELAASAVGEIVPGNEFYDYEDKYLQDKAELRMPADLPSEVTEKVRELAVQAFAAVGGAGMARVDFLLDTEGRLYVNEINTLPGFTRISMYPKLWELSGVPLPALVGRLVEIALARHRRRARLDRVIKDWLSGVG